MKTEWENIIFESIEISGILHPGLVIKGKFKNKRSQLKFISNHKELNSNILNLDEKNFYYFVYLSRKDKKIEIFENDQVLFTIKNRFYLRFAKRMKEICSLFFKKAIYILKAIGSTIKNAWKTYHFIIPPKLWKEFFTDFKQKLNYENNQYYHPDNIKGYHKWLKENEREEEIVELKYNPLISILIPVYNVPSNYLKECLDSILNQTYKNFEICLVDDCSTREETIQILKEYEGKDKRIKVHYRTKNGHISVASNDALKMAKGEFIALVDNDDVLNKNALYDVVKALNEKKNIDFLYSDEDKLNVQNERCYPHFKPDFSPDTLLGNNYICHFSVIRKSIVKKVGGFEVGLEGAQDHDLFLKISEISSNFYHIPKILYHWRMTESSTALSADSKSYAFQNGQRCIENALKRRNLKAQIVNDQNGYYIVNYEITEKPLISIIIPTRDYADTLKKCVDSIYEKTTYKNYEIIVVNNNSEKTETYELFEYYKKLYKNFRVLDANMEFNYLKINNLAVKESKGEYIVLLNNDTEVITDNWLEIMLGYASLKHIGAVGVKLIYPDEKIQHAGVVLGIRGIAGHAFINYDRTDSGLYNRMRIPYNYSAITAACLMVKKEKFNEVDGLEEKLTVAFNDVDFNLKLLKKGYYNICLPQVELYHYESKSRGYDTTLEKQQRSLQEQNLMLKKWNSILKNDPMYNKNLSLKRNFMLDKK